MMEYRTRNPDSHYITDNVSQDAPTGCRIREIDIANVKIICVKNIDMTATIFGSAGFPVSCKVWIQPYLYPESFGRILSVDSKMGEYVNGSCQVSSVGSRSPGLTVIFCRDFYISGLENYREGSFY
jgi:hypothetical protein